ncbi:hypothetical protein Poli38472_001730 [Pythium oligandrum]|uniref:Phospholipid/glycerol acyltransferase domain-containing protein n=1 Tax=Pythium oligandrum TaxID=41045 RepID=A0A8K1CUN8_PYTOL|nr:hypothetical protein Poli38472_001730 [Pythium oligandrum]|eukprot:TMW69574.1 hypothetical protein Poli38472_001730 [Pythium oligandrum]
MEKYSRWSDLTTGINPFVPQQQPLHANVGVKVLQVLAGSALVLVRVPLLTVGGLLLVLTNVIVSILGFVPFLGRFLKRLTEWLLCSLLLLILGVFVSEEGANTRRLGLTTPGAKQAKGSTRVGPKDIVVCNHTSFVEILYLARRFSPTFVFVDEESAAKGLVHACGLIEAIYRGLTPPVLQSKGTPRKIEDVIRRASGPIAIFPEGVRSNGKSVLRFLPILEQLSFELPGSKQPLRIHLVAFRYEFKNFSPAHSAGGGIKHVLWTSFYGYHSLRVTHLHAKDLNVQDVGPATRSKAASTATQLTKVQVERLRGLLAAMLRTKPVDLSVKDFISFNAYWDHVKSGGKKSAAEFTDRKAPHEHAQWSTRK